MSVWTGTAHPFLPYVHINRVLDRRHSHWMRVRQPVCVAIREYCARYVFVSWQLVDRIRISIIASFEQREALCQ